MDKIAVLGGGVAGVIAAKHLADKGISVDLIEKETRLGGLHRSVRLDGLEFDVGAFYFSDQHQLLLSFPFLRERFVQVNGRAISITPCGSACRYPMTLRNYLHDNGPTTFVLSACELLISRIRHSKRTTVPSFAKYYMGAQIYRRSGLQHYIERLFGIKDEELDLQFALQRLSQIRQYTPVGMARRRLKDLWRRIVPKAGVSRSSLVRPVEGFEAMYGEIAGALTYQGVNVHLGKVIKAIRRHAHRGYEMDFGDHKEKYRRVISTIPIPVMLRLLGEVPRARVEHAALISLFYRGKIRYDTPLLYNFTTSGCWKRIVILSSFYGPVDGDDYFTVEITTRDTSPAHIAILRADFEAHAGTFRLSLPGRQLRYLGGVITERAYPLFRRGTSIELQAERHRLAALGIDFVGRQGSFAYVSSHVAAERAAQLAITVAQQCVDETPHWPNTKIEKGVRQGPVQSIAAKAVCGSKRIKPKKINDPQE